MDKRGSADSRRKTGSRCDMVFLRSLMRPIRAFRLAYLPLIMVYFAYGALGLIDVTRDFWIKEKLTLTPSELAGIGVWLTLPWTVKMVFGELVDCVPILGSQRRVYIVIGALFTASGLVTLAGAAGGWLAFLPPNQLYLFGSLLIVIGTVIQDVVADAMSTEVVSRVTETGEPKPDHEVRSELGMVQVLGRLSLSVGVLAVAGLSGVLAGWFSRETVFLIGLVIPLISLIGVALIARGEGPNRGRSTGASSAAGIVFGAAVLALALGGVPYSQEIIFLISMGVICAMLVFVTRDLDHKSRMAILYTTIIIFAFRATPGGRRRLFLVDARHPEIRRAFLRHPAPDRRDPGAARDVAVCQAAHRIFGDQDAVLAGDDRHVAVAAEHRAVLWACMNGPRPISVSARVRSRSSTPPRRRPSRSCA